MKALEARLLTNDAVKYRNPSISIEEVYKLIKEEAEKGSNTIIGIYINDDTYYKLCDNGYVVKNYPDGYTIQW